MSDRNCAELELPDTVAMDHGTKEQTISKVFIKVNNHNHIFLVFQPLQGFALKPTLTNFAFKR